MWRVVGAVVRKELNQTFRDRQMIAMLFIAPLVQTTVFGFAVNLDLVAEPTVVVDRDRSEASRAVVRIVETSEAFDLVAVVGSDAEAEELVAAGDAAVAVHVPRGYATALARNEAEILVALDGSDSNTALRASQELGQLLANQARVRQRAILGAAAAAAGRAPDRIAPSLRLEPRAWFNPELKTAVFLVPGVLAMVLLVVAMMLTSMGLTREKEMGTLEQVMVSPVRPAELIAGKTLPFAIIGLANVTLVVSLAVLVFGVPFRGSVVALLIASAIFLMATLGLGLFISTVSSTQQQAMLGAFFVMLPALLLSGFVFPVDNMPLLARWIARVNPLTYYIEIVRGVMVKGSSLGDLKESLLALAAIGLAVFAAAAARFKKRVA